MNVYVLKLGWPWNWILATAELGEGGPDQPPMVRRSAVDIEHRDISIATTAGRMSNKLD